MLAERIVFMGHARDRAGLYRGRDGAGFQLVFPAGEQAVRRALSTTTGALNGMGLDRDAVGLVEIVLAEALNNVVEHAYSGREGGIIEVDARIVGDRLRLTIQDEGVAMPDGCPPEARRHDLTVSTDNLPEGGFGWSIIRDLTQDLHYENDGVRNRVSFAIDLAEIAQSI